MISFWDRVRLSFSYGWLLLFSGAVLNLVSGLLLTTSFIYSGIVLSLIIKLLCSGVVLYLQRQFENRDAVYFYINLGLTRRRMLATVLAFDYLVWAFMVTIIVIAQ